VQREVAVVKRKVEPRHLDGTCSCVCEEDEKGSRGGKNDDGCWYSMGKLLSLSRIISLAA
jgi:hypothetical protein